MKRLLALNGSNERQTRLASARVASMTSRLKPRARSESFRLAAVATGARRHNASKLTVPVNASSCAWPAPLGSQHQAPVAMTPTLAIVVVVEALTPRHHHRSSSARGWHSDTGNCSSSAIGPGFGFGYEQGKKTTSMSSGFLLLLGKCHLLATNNHPTTTTTIA